MANRRKTVEEVERLLRDVGSKIDELIEKGKEVSGEAGDEIDKKIVELKANKEGIERDFHDRKRKFEQSFHDKKRAMDPKLKRSAAHFKEAFVHLNEAIKALFSK